MIETYLEYLDLVPFFAPLSRKMKAEVSQHLAPVSFEKGQVIFRKQEEGSEFYIIQKGKVKIVLPSEEGGEIILAILSEGDFFGELSLIDGEPRSASAVAVEWTRLLTLGRFEFLEFLTDHPDALRHVLGILSRRLRRTDALMGDTCFLDVPARLAKRLLELANAYGQPEKEGEVVEIKLSQRELAEMVGATRESVNKHLRKFKDEGILDYERGAFTIISRVGLQRVVKG